MSEQRSRPGPMAIGTQFFLIGCVAFGGFMALISVIEEVCVERLGWLSREEMLDGISLANVLPGPQAVNTVTYVAYRVGGPVGALAGFVGILTPTFVLVTLLTFLYFGVARDLTWLDGFFAGMVPAVAAVIVSVVRRLFGKAVTTTAARGLFGLSVVASLLAPPSLKLSANLGVLLIAAIMGGVLLKPDTAAAPTGAKLPLARVVALVAMPLMLAGAYLSGPPVPNDGIVEIILTFSGLSVMLFGGGYVFIPMILDVVVTQQGWLTPAEFNDGIAFSQITPGPIMISAAFIGQKVMMERGILWGIAGGLAGTVAIFGPPALIMVGAADVLDHVRGSRVVQGALRGLRAAVVGMILVAAYVIFSTGLPPLSSWAVEVRPLVTSVVIFTLSSYALIGRKWSVLAVLPSAGVLGLALSQL